MVNRTHQSCYTCSIWMYLWMNIIFIQNRDDTVYAMYLPNQNFIDLGDPRSVMKIIYLLQKNQQAGIKQSN